MKKLPPFTQLRVNILSGPITSGLNVLVLAISYPLYLHFLGYEKVGVWLLLCSVQTFAQLGLLGIGPALTKIVAEELGRGNRSAAQAYLSLSTAILAITGFFALSGVTVFKMPIVHAMGLTGDNATAAISLLPWVGLLTGLGFLNQATAAALAGVGRIDIANFNATIGKILALALEAILLLKKVGLVTLLLGDFAGCAVIQIVGTIQLRQTAGLHLLKNLSFDKQRLAELLSFGGNMLIASVAVLLVSPFNKWALSRYAGVALVPIYDIAFNGSMQLRGLVEVGLRALMPAISHRLANDTSEARASVAALYKRTTLYLLAILPPAYAIALLTAKPMLSLWLGSRFVPEIVSTFDIMSASAIVSLTAVPAYFTLMAAGHVRDCTISHLISAVLNIAVITIAIAWTGHLSLVLASLSVLFTMIASSSYLMLRVRAVLSSKLSDPPATLPPSLNRDQYISRQAA